MRSKLDTAAPEKTRARAGPDAVHKVAMKVMHNNEYVMWDWLTLASEVFAAAPGGKWRAASDQLRRQFEGEGRVASVARRYANAPQPISPAFAGPRSPRGCGAIGGRTLYQHASNPLPPTGPASTSSLRQQ